MWFSPHSLSLSLFILFIFEDAIFNKEKFELLEKIPNFALNIDKY